MSAPDAVSAVGDAPTLRTEDLPDAFRTADEVAVEAQKRLVRWTGWQLTFLVLAAAASIIAIKVGHIIVGGLVLFVLFAAALLLAMRLAVEGPAETWYRARAGAGSIKTLAWRYAVGGDPFFVTLPPRDADLLFEERLESVVATLADLDWRRGSTGAQITPAMRELRRQDLETRKRAYRHGRLEDQRRWYSAKAEYNARRASQWRAAEIVANFIGLLGAALRMADLTPFNEYDLLGIAATFATAAAAWNQSRQFRAVAVSYAVAGHELSLVEIRLDYVDSEDEWAAFVHDAESATSREHCG